MKYTRIIFLLAAVMVVLHGAARAQEVLTVDGAPGKGPVLKITVPAGWKGRVVQQARPSVVLWAPAEGKPACVVILDLMWGWPDPPAYDDPELAGELEMVEFDKPEGVKTVPVKFRGKEGYGVYETYGHAAQAAYEGLAEMNETSMASGLYWTKGWQIGLTMHAVDAKGKEFAEGLKFAQEGIVAGEKSQATPVPSPTPSVASPEVIAAAPPPPPAEKVEEWARFAAPAGLTQEKMKKNPVEGKLIWSEGYSSGKQPYYMIALFERGTLFGGNRAKMEQMLADTVAKMKARNGGRPFKEDNYMRIEEREGGRKVFYSVGAIGPGGGMFLAFTSLPGYDVLVEQVTGGGPVPQALLPEIMPKLEEYLQKGK